MLQAISYLIQDSRHEKLLMEPAKQTYSLIFFEILYKMGIKITYLSKNKWSIVLLGQLSLLDGFQRSWSTTEHTWQKNIERG